MSEHYDVIVIGGGPGGYNCAIRAGQLGLKVLCVEARKTLGGTCLNVGCIPSKALLHASELYEAANTDFAGLGIKTSVSLDLKTMMASKEKTVTGLTQGIEFLFKKNKVEHVFGTGTITGPGKVKVGGTTFSGTNIVVATGSEVATLPGIEIDEKQIVSSTGALALPKVPKSMVVVGAGVIGLELGSVWRRLGAEVTFIEYQDAILPDMDAEVQKQALRIFKKQKLKFKLGRKVTGVTKQKTGVSVQTEAAKGGKPETLAADVVLVCIGRRPYTEGLGLDSVGAKLDKRGFIQTEHFKAADNVYAIGDCTAGPMLAHKAEEEGTAAAEIIAGLPGHIDFNRIPGVVYTKPEIAAIGQTEQELKDEGRAYKSGKFPFMANSRARANHDTDGFVKILADAHTDEVLGAHMIGTGTGDMIHEIALAMAFHASAEDIARICHAHPTQSEAVRQAAMDVGGWAMQM